MKTLTRAAILLSLICLFYLPVPAQKKTVRKVSKASTTICKVSSVPKGMVIVGYKANASCAGGLELTVKPPAEYDTVCADSPIPDGYSVSGVSGSLACSNGDSNPLTNALTVRSDAAPVAVVSRTSSAPARQVNRSPVSSESEQAEQGGEKAGPGRDEIDLAIRRQTVLLGMDMQDVSRAWGTSHTSDSLTEQDGISYIWEYKRGRVYFRNGKAYKIILLKG